MVLRSKWPTINKLQYSHTKQWLFVWGSTCISYLRKRFHYNNLIGIITESREKEEQKYVVNINYKNEKQLILVKPRNLEIINLGVNIPILCVGVPPFPSNTNWVVADGSIYWTKSRLWFVGKKNGVSPPKDSI